MVRSILLRGFDQDLANKIGEILKRRRVKFLHDSIPIKFAKNESGKVVVEYNNTKEKNIGKEEFDTVILAVGRAPNTKNIGLDKIGVKLSENHKVIVNEKEASNIENIYSIGDCAEGRPELTPPAIVVIYLFIVIKFNTLYRQVSYSHKDYSAEVMKIWTTTKLQLQSLLQ